MIEEGAEAIATFPVGKYGCRLTVTLEVGKPYSIVAEWAPKTPDRTKFTPAEQEQWDTGLREAFQGCFDAICGPGIVTAV